MHKTLYFNLEDDIKKIAGEIKKEPAEDLVLVFPKQSYLFSDGVNLKMLKKQTDLLGKHISITTMDERGLVYAKDAGFAIKFLPHQQRQSASGDIRVHAVPKAETHVVPKESVPKKTVVPVQKVVKVKKARPIPRAVGPVVPKVQVTDTIFPDLSPSTELVRKKSSGTRDRVKKVIIASVALVLLVVVLLVTVVLPKATVYVYAKTDPVARDVEVSLRTDAQNSDVSKLILPATVVDKTLEYSDKFTTLGKKEIGSKAEGKVRIFNFSGTPLNLKATTTTLSFEGKSYVFTEDQNYIKPLKPAQVSDPNAGQVAVVTATTGGGESNVPSGSRLEITNQVFGSKPQLLYARAESDITGGNSRFLSVVSQDDLTKAQKSLTDSLFIQLKTDLQQQNLILDDRGFISEVISFSSDKPLDAESPAFQGSIKVHFQGLAFNKDSLNTLLRNRIKQSMPQNKQLQASGLDSVSYSVKDLNVSAGTATLSSHIESKAIDTINVADLGSTLVGKTKEEASEILLAHPEISKVDIILSPRWQKSLPHFASKITVKEH